MQLSSWCLAALSLGIWQSEARAQPVAEGRFGNRTAVYVDSDETTIITNTTEAGSLINQEWQLGAHYLVDVVSSASVDVATQATAKMEDTRHDVGGSGGYRSDDGRTLVGAYSYSTEHDWESHNANLTGGIDMRDRSLTLGINLGFQDNTITRAGDACVPGARALEDYADEIAKELELADKPACQNCHAVGSDGVATDTAFADALKSRGFRAATASHRCVALSSGSLPTAPTVTVMAAATWRS